MGLYFGNGSGSPQADRRYDMAMRLTEWGDHAAAADLLRQGLEMAPGWPPLHFQLGEALRRLNETEAAKTAFHAYLTLDAADAMGATIKLSLLGATSAPAIMPEEYVRSLFDQYAPSFEKSLVGNLEYHTPDRIAGMVLAQRDHFTSLLDLGCGTGLAAQFFEGKADRMVGVDLAPGMIAQARAKDIYADLHEQSLDAFFTQNDDTFDLVLAADVFVYIGALEDVTASIARALAANGLYAFSVQTLAGTGWALGEDHRYAHSHAYIEIVLRDAGLSLLAMEDNVPLRLDRGEPILGTLILARKSP